MKNLARSFYERSPELVARELLGKLLVHKLGKDYYVGRIVETEAYLGEGDAASHSHRGKTKRNAVMFGPAGHSYVYFTYGIHWLLNFVTEKEGRASAVLIRALQPLTEPSSEKIASGPAKLTKWMGITGEQNDVDVTKSNKLFVTEKFSHSGGTYLSDFIQPKNIIATERVGVDYAGEHKKLPLRFYIKDSKFISKN